MQRVHRVAGLWGHAGGKLSELAGANMQITQPFQQARVIGLLQPVRARDIQKVIGRRWRIPEGGVRGVGRRFRSEFARVAPRCA